MYLGIEIALIILEGLNLTINGVNYAPETLGMILMFGGCLQLSRQLKDKKFLYIGFGFILLMILNLIGLPSTIESIIRVIFYYLLFVSLFKQTNDRVLKRLANWFIGIQILSSIILYLIKSSSEEFFYFTALFFLIVKVICTCLLALHLYKLDKEIDYTPAPEKLNEISINKLHLYIIVPVIVLAFLVNPIQRYFKMHSAQTQYLALESESSDIYIDNIYKNEKNSFQGQSISSGQGVIYIKEQLFGKCKSIYFETANKTQQFGQTLEATDEVFRFVYRDGYKSAIVNVTIDTLLRNNTITLNFKDGTSAVYDLRIVDRAKQFEVYDAIGEKVSVKGIKVYDGIMYEIESIESRYDWLWIKYLDSFETNDTNYSTYIIPFDYPDYLQIYDAHQNLIEEVKVVKR